MTKDEIQTQNHKITVNNFTNSSRKQKNNVRGRHVYRYTNPEISDVPITSLETEKMGIWAVSFEGKAWKIAMEPNTIYYKFIWRSPRLSLKCPDLKMKIPLIVTLPVIAYRLRELWPIRLKDAPRVFWAIADIYRLGHGKRVRTISQSRYACRFYCEARAIASLHASNVPRLPKHQWFFKVCFSAEFSWYFLRRDLF